MIGEGEFLENRISPFFSNLVPERVFWLSCFLFVLWVIPWSLSYPRVWDLSKDPNQLKIVIAGIAFILATPLIIVFLGFCLFFFIVFLRIIVGDI